MLTDKELTQYYSFFEGLYAQALNEVIGLLDMFLAKCPEIEDIYRDMTKPWQHRVKPLDSLLRKCQQDKLSDIREIPQRIEDLLGLRLLTVNKEQAKRLFEFLEGRENSWFCKIASPLHFVPYTISSGNFHSLRTGYQAYHITFVYERDFGPMTEETRWPVEIQVMPQLWDFWARYSRKYFYRGSNSTDRLMPYNIAISKILDAADDMMFTTTKMLQESDQNRDTSEKEKTSAPSSSKPETIKSDEAHMVTE